MKKFIPFLVVFLIIGSVIGYFGYQVWERFYGIPSDAPTGLYTFQVEEGDTFQTVARDLEEDNVAYETAILFHANQVGTETLLTGTYQIELDETSPQDVIRKINDESLRIAQERAENVKPTVRVTFPEGITADRVATLLEQGEVVSSEQFLEYIQDPDSFTDSEFAFLPEPLSCEYGDLDNCAKYYLEGYLYPDTYDFILPSTPEQVVDVMLSNFDFRVWQQLEPQQRDLGEFTQAVIMASVIEKESGRPLTGVNESNIEELNLERRKIARVFYNRLDIGDRWRSDVTVAYPYGKRVCQQTLEVEDCVFLDSPEADNPYNTYRISDYPIGPVTSPRFDNVFAALNPTEGSELFFVSDATGKNYFATTQAEHEANIQRAIEINAGLDL